jgi:hypothetical protein
MLDFKILATNARIKFLLIEGKKIVYSWLKKYVDF